MVKSWRLLILTCACVLQFGVKTARVSEALLCNSTGETDSHVDFTFEHQEAGRDMLGKLAVGSVRR